MLGLQVLAASAAMVTPPKLPPKPTAAVTFESSPSPDGNNNKKSQTSLTKMFNVAMERDSRDQAEDRQDQPEERARHPSEVDAESRSVEATQSVPTGFADLCFTQFSTDKFALVARAWCEVFPRRASSIFFNYTCIDCERAFPCPSALAVHRNAHVPGNTVNCVECQVWFDSPTQQRIHQLKHAARKVVLTYFGDTSPATEEPKEIQDQISQEDFLCSMGLQKVGSKTHPESRADAETENVSTPVKIHSAFPRFDQRVNRDYFTHFNRLASYELAQQIARGFVGVPQEPEVTRFASNAVSNGNTAERDFANVDQILRMASGADTSPIRSLQHRFASGKTQLLGLKRCCEEKCQCFNIVSQLFQNCLSLRR